jgi:hypothetical protein
MKMFSGYHFAGTLAFFLLLLAAPAFGQFEVSPDHFDGPLPTNTQKKASIKTPITQAKSQHQTPTAKANTTKKQTAAEIAQLRKPQPGTRADAHGTMAKKNGASTNLRHGPASTTAQTGPSLKAQALPARRE